MKGYATIRVGPVEYRVVFERILSEGEVPRDGEIDFTSTTIRISPDATGDHVTAILWHEIVHAMLWQAGSEHWDNESLVRTLAYAIPDVLQRNPHLALRMGKTVDDSESSCGAASGANHRVITDS